MAHVRQTRCSKCQYPLLALKNFNGDSSRDAPTLEAPYRTPTATAGCGPMFAEILVDIFGEIFKGIGLMWRRRKVSKKKEEILPQFPNSVICPQCLGVLQRP